MESRPQAFTVDKVCKDVAKNKYIFDHPLQRKSEQWNKGMKTLLIDSVFRGYLMDRILLAVEDKKYIIIDGVQRISTLVNYRNNGFSLGAMEVPFEDLSGKKYEELSEEYQSKIDDFQLYADILTEWTEEEIKDMFERRNNGKPLNKAQKMTVQFSSELGRKILHLMDNDFIAKTMTPAQIRNADDRLAILQILMVLSGYEYSGFDNEKDIIPFIHWLETYEKQDELIEHVDQMMTRLVEILPKKVLKKKTVVPMIVIAFDSIYGNEGLELAYMEWLDNFYKNYNQEEFKNYCGTGTTKSENVKGRLDYFKNAVDNLIPLAIPETEKTEEVEQTEDTVAATMENADTETNN